MRALISFFCALFLVGLYANCSGGFNAASSAATGGITTSSSGGSANNGSGSTGSTTVTPGANTMAVSVGCGYVDEPCVSVTICQPGTTSCQTINNVLLDTGSYGLRLFSSVVSLPLTGLSDSSGRTIGECMSYADGSDQWGPVKKADIVMGGETASNISIQLIDSSFGTAPTSCDNQDANPTAAGFNGILGVGLFTEDCGTTCQTSADNQIYYGCSGTSCSGTEIATTAQVANPVSFLPVSNNGVILTLPTISASGADGVTGTLTLGIGTQGDNTPGSVTTFSADENGNFLTTYNGTSTDAFIDSGSNANYFASAITQCPSSGDDNGFYCPTSTKSVTATQVAASGGTSEAITFSVANTTTLTASNRTAYNNIAGTASGYFDWGLPFFFGRSVYVGTDGKSSTLGSGAYWAY